MIRSDIMQAKHDGSEALTYALVGHNIRVIIRLDDWRAVDAEKRRDRGCVLRTHKRLPVP